MKKFGLLTIVVMLTGAVQAQIMVGPKAGLNISTCNFSNATNYKPESKMTFGAQVGGMIQMQLMDKLYLQPALVFAMKGYKTDEKEIFIDYGMGGTYTSPATSTTLKYLEIPINVAYGFGDEDMQIQVFAGPYFGYGLMGTQTSDAEGAEDIDIAFGKQPEDPADKTIYLSAVDYGLNVGVGLRMNTILINAGYGLGLAYLYPETQYNTTELEGVDLVVNGEATNAVIQVTAAYMFEL
jgi:hypothetical protein